MATTPNTRGRGRPSMLTPELGSQILAKVRGGLPIELAAERCGISKNTVIEWVRRGEGRDPDREPDEVYVDFATRYRQARAEFAEFLMQPCLETILGKRQSRKIDPATGRKKLVKALGAPLRANEAHWHLARRFPEHWGQGREAAALVAAAIEGEAQGDEAPTITIILAKDDESVERDDAIVVADAGDDAGPT